MTDDPLSADEMAFINQDRDVDGVLRAWITHDGDRIDAEPVSDAMSLLISPGHTGHVVVALVDGTGQGPGLVMEPEAAVTLAANLRNAAKIARYYRNLKAN